MIVERPKDENLCIMPDHPLAETEYYRLYLGRGENTADAFLCRVVKNQTLNGVAFLEQKTLKRLADLSEDLERARIAQQGDDGKKIHYDWLFPVCEQSFSATQLNGRRINVLSIRDAELDGFIPFSKLKAEVKVDAKSAAWVLGRFLKLQAFLDEDEKCRDCPVIGNCPTCYGINYNASRNVYHVSDDHCRMMKVQFLANAMFKYRQYAMGQLRLTPEDELKLLRNIKAVQTLAD